MKTVSSRTRALAAVLGALIASACASATPAPRFSAVSPAEAAGPESAVLPAQPILTGAGELAEKPGPDSTSDKDDTPPGPVHHHHPDPPEPNP